MKQAVQFVLRCYQRFVSPMLPHSCRFVPTCSQYACGIERHGAIGRLVGTCASFAALPSIVPLAATRRHPVCGAWDGDR